MAGEISVLPLFLARDYALYMAPIIEYNKAYDALDKQYRELQSTASVLESLQAGDADSLAYLTYRNYMNNLESRANDLMNNGLTPESRALLYEMLQAYAPDILPIITGMLRKQADLAAYALLKSNEVGTYNPNERSIDEYITNPSNFRTADLKDMREQGLLIGKAASERINTAVTGNSNISQQKINDGTLLVVLYLLNGFFEGGPGKHSVLGELDSAASILTAMWNNPKFELSEEDMEHITAGVQGLMDTLKSVGYEDFSAKDQERMLESLLVGYNLGLTGNAHSQIVNTGLGGSGGSGAQGKFPTVHAFTASENTVPLLGHTAAMNDLAEDVTKQAPSDFTRENGILKYDPKDKFTIFTYTKVGFLGSRPRDINSSYSLVDILRNYKDITENENSEIFKTITEEARRNSSTVSVENIKKQIEPIMKILDTYNPDIAKAIKEGTVDPNTDLSKEIQTAVTRFNEQNKDYGVKVLYIRIGNNLSADILTHLREQINNGTNPLHLTELLSDGSGYNIKADADSDAADLLKATDAKVTLISWVPSDGTALKLTIEGTVKSEHILKDVVIPVESLNNNMVTASKARAKDYLGYNNFLKENGHFREPSSVDDKYWTPMEKLYVKINALHTQTNNLNSPEATEYVLSLLTDKERELLTQYNQYILKYNSWYNAYVKSLLGALNLTETTAFNLESGNTYSIVQ